MRAPVTWSSPSKWGHPLRLPSVSTMIPLCRFFGRWFNTLLQQGSRLGREAGFFSNTFVNHLGAIPCCLCEDNRTLLRHNMDITPWRGEH